MRMANLLKEIFVHVEQNGGQVDGGPERGQWLAENVGQQQISIAGVEVNGLENFLQFPVVGKPS
jgi:hypothetical protein